MLAEQDDERLAGPPGDAQRHGRVARLVVGRHDARTGQQRREVAHDAAEHLQAAQHPGDASLGRVDVEDRQPAHEGQRGQRDVAGGVVRQLAYPGLVAHDDRAQALALDDRRVWAVQRDAHAQRSRAVQQLARQSDREIGLGVARAGQEIARSRPRAAPLGDGLV